MTERGLQPVLNGNINLFAHTTKIPVNITVGKTQNLQAQSGQKCGTFCVICHTLRLIMLRSIYFDNQLCRSAVKIHNESADDPLFVNLYRVFAKKRYQSLRSWGVISLRSRRAFSNWLLSFGMVIVCPLRPRCARPPLPKGDPSALSAGFATSSPKGRAKCRVQRTTPKGV